MRYLIGIPSYKRPDKQTTVEYLHQLGFDPKSIILSTQSREDYEQYQKWAEKATIIYKEGYCVGDNRNSIIEYCNSQKVHGILMLDDDIKALNILEGSKSRAITEGEEFREIIDRCFRCASANNAPLWGVYPVDNDYFKHEQIRDQSLLIGTMLGFLTTKVSFNRNYRVKEDYELCCRIISKGGKCLRFDMLSVAADHYSKGGCESVWKDSTNLECAINLEAQYPRLIKRQEKKPDEVKAIFKSNNIWQKNTTFPHDGLMR